VSNPRKKPLIGIIGGIAAGKSCVAAEFGKLGCAVIDADTVAHEVLEDDPVRDEIIRQFGPGALSETGRVDRPKLGRIVFADGEKLATLNRIIHPRVFRRTEELLARYERDEAVRAVVLDMPLLIEVGWAERCDRIVFVHCTQERRWDRAKRTRGLTGQEVKNRENFQISLDTKRTLADNTVDNNSGFSTLVRQIKIIFSDVVKNS